jgi:hypothetical protein
LLFAVLVVWREPEGHVIDAIFAFQKLSTFLPKVHTELSIKYYPNIYLDGLWKPMRNLS